MHQYLARVGAVANPNNPAEAFAEYAADRMWIASHLAQFLGIAGLGVALVALAAVMDTARASAWARIGAFGAAASVATAAVLQAVDGVALKVMVDRWAEATGEARARAFEGALAVRQIEIGLASLLGVVFGLTILAFSVSLFFSRRFAAWLAWVGFIGGSGTVAAGVAQAYTGFSAVGMTISMSATAVLFVWVIAVGIVMWRVAVRLPDQAGTPSGGRFRRKRGTVPLPGAARSPLRRAARGTGACREGAPRGYLCSLCGENVSATSPSHVPHEAVPMNYVVTLCVLGLAAASMAAAQDLPSALAALVAKARLDGSVAAWCRAEFRSGHPGAFAVAVTVADGGGRYVALDSDGRVTELGSFKGTADLSCYSRAQAEDLHATIQQSETVDGQVTPRWKTTVVCGFVDDTAATCWQYSPRDRTFVKVGGWVT